MFITHIYSQNISEILDKSCLKPVALWPGTFYFLALGKACWRLSCPASPVPRQKRGMAWMSLFLRPPKPLARSWKKPGTLTGGTAQTPHKLPCLLFFTWLQNAKSWIRMGGVPLIEPMKSKINEDGVNLSMSMIEQVHFVICSSELYNPASQSSK